MKKIYIIIAIVIAFLVLLGSCFNPFLPIYKKTEEDGLSVYIDGVQYKRDPPLIWRPILGPFEEIGYANDWSDKVFAYKNDVDKDFIFVKWILQDYYGPVLYNSQKQFPSVSTENIDKIIWFQEIILNPTGEDRSESISQNVIADKALIGEMLSLIETKDGYESRRNFMRSGNLKFLAIELYSDRVKCANIVLDIGRISDKLVVRNFNDKYVMIPEDLVVKFSGMTAYDIINW